MSEFEHYSVLLEESIDGLAIKSDGIYVDCTLGGAGHSRKILEKLNAEGHLYAFDQDRVAIENAERELKTYIENGQVTLIKSNFRHIKEELESRNVFGVDGIAFLLGLGLLPCGLGSVFELLCYMVGIVLVYPGENVDAGRGGFIPTRAASVSVRRV